MDVFGGKVVNGTLYREIKYQFDSGRFSVGWRSKGSEPAVFLQGMTTVQKEINKTWTEDMIAEFLGKYDSIFSLQTIQGSLQFGFRTQNYWAMVEALPPAERRAFENVLGQSLSIFRRLIAQWTSENGRISNKKEITRHPQRRNGHVPGPGPSSPNHRRTAPPKQQQQQRTERGAHSAATVSTATVTVSQDLKDLYQSVGRQYNEIEALQCQTVVLYQNIVEMLTNSEQPPIGEDNLNQFMSAISRANELSQKHKECVRLYSEHAHIAGEQQEAQQREIAALSKLVERQKEEIKALHRAAHRGNEQNPKRKSPAVAANAADVAPYFVPHGPHRESPRRTEHKEPSQDIRDRQRIRDTPPRAKVAKQPPPRTRNAAPATNHRPTHFNAERDARGVDTFYDDVRRFRDNRNSGGVQWLCYQEPPDHERYGRVIGGHQSRNARFSPLHGQQNGKSNSRNNSGNIHTQNRVFKNVKGRIQSNISDHRFERNFYRPHPECLQMSARAVAEWKLEHGIQIEPGYSEYIGSGQHDQFASRHRSGTESKAVIPNPILSFDHVTWPKDIERSIRQSGFEAPSPIQSATWPLC